MIECFLPRATPCSMQAQTSSMPPRDLGHQDAVAAAREPGVGGQDAAAAAHDLDHERALVARGGVAHLAHGVADGVERRVEADGRVGAGNVVVDGARDPDGRHPARVERLGAAVRPVAADDDEPGDAVLVEHPTASAAPRRSRSAPSARCRGRCRPRSSTPPTSESPSGRKQPLSSPSKPCSMPTTSQPLAMAERTTARTAAFMPGASPPLVSTAILRTLSHRAHPSSSVQNSPIARSRS